MDSLELTELTSKHLINQLIYSHYIDDNEKKQLTKYRKEIRNNKVNVLYKLSRDSCLDPNMKGRLFAKGAMSLQLFRREIRHTLAKDIYVDIDIVNCHPIILKQICNKNSWKCDRLDEYIQHREKLLPQFMKKYNIDRDTTKKAILTIINGGEALDDSSQFVREFREELKAIRNNLMNSEKEILAFVKDKRRKIKNIDGSVMNIKLCEVENEILMEMVKFFRMKELNVGVLAFDGLMIEKNDLITPELLNECCKYVKDQKQWDIQLVIKPMDQGFDMSIFDKEDYDNVKNTFEKDVAKLMNPACYIKDMMTEPKIINRVSLNENYGNKWCYLNGERKQFLKLWLKDESIKTYENIDFLPHPLVCPEETYNLYTGLAGSKLYYDTYDLTLIAPVLNHIDKLTGNDPVCAEYFLDWLADIVQNAGKLLGIAIVFRSDEGAGKNIFLDFFGNKVLGKEYFFSTAQPDKLFDRFSNGYKNKLLVNMDETKGKDGFENSEKIKNLITAETVQYEEKGKDSISLSNFARWIFTTNNDTPIKITYTDRRFVVFDCDNSICGNIEYFNNLSKSFEDDQVAYTFYKYLNERDISNKSLKGDNRPKTTAYKDIMSATIPSYYFFLDVYINKFQMNNVKKTNKEMYIAFKKYSSNNGYHFNYTQHQTSRLFNKIDGITKYHTSTDRGFDLDIEKIRAFLDKYLD